MKVKINFYESESMEYELERTDISYDDRYVFITTGENDGVAIPKDDVMNIEIEENQHQKSMKSFLYIKQAKNVDTYRV